MLDSHERNIDYMRISITDRCNLRCRYCTPEDIALIDKSEILQSDEIKAVCEAAAELGIKNIRITGGEPLVRRDCQEVIKKIKDIGKIESISMTTNGVWLKEKLDGLRKAGLDSVNISLDTVDRKMYEQICGRDSLPDVIEAIQEAKKYMSVKLNCVLIAGMNDKLWPELLDFADKMHTTIRFIELMPIGFGKGFSGVKNADILKEMEKKYSCVKKSEKRHGCGPSEYYHIEGMSIDIGFISAVNNTFCKDCNRIRLSSTGFLKQCLCYDSGVDLKKIIREHDKAKLITEMKNAIYNKPAEHCFSELYKITEQKSMIKIGG